MWNTVDRILLFCDQWYVDLDAEKYWNNKNDKDAMMIHVLFFNMWKSGAYTGYNVWSISREELCCKQDGGKPLNSRHPEYKARDTVFS
jgi:hypothetical protein